MLQFSSSIQTRHRDLFAFLLAKELREVERNRGSLGWFRGADKSDWPNIALKFKSNLFLNNNNHLHHHYLASEDRSRMNARVLSPLVVGLHRRFSKGGVVTERSEL